MGDEASQTEFFSDVSHKLPIYVEFTGKTLTLVKAKIQNREGEPGDGHEVNYETSAPTSGRANRRRSTPSSWGAARATSDFPEQ